MSIINVIKYENNHEEFIHKFPIEDIKLGSQLIVNVAQIAFFVKGGQIFDQFGSGTYTLSTENIPLLNKLINIPFGNNSPFQAEVWFVSLVSKLDLKWGTITPIQLEDPKYGIIIPIRAFGQYGIRVSNPRLFFESLVGNMDSFSSEKINEYFKGKLLSSLTTIISKKLINDQISILEISSLLDELSNYAKVNINDAFSNYGLEIVNFYFASINIPENDPSVIKLKESKDLAAKLKILGNDLYQMDRSFNVLDKAAENDGGIAGSLAGAGLGLSLGVGIGHQMSNVTGNLNTAPTPPPFESQLLYFLVINGGQSGPYNFSQIKEFILNRRVDTNTMVWKQGMATWAKISEVTELLEIINSTTPPPINTI